MSREPAVMVTGSGTGAMVESRSTLAWDTVERDSVTARSTSRSDFLTVLRKEPGGWRIERQMYILK